MGMRRPLGEPADENRIRRDRPHANARHQHSPNPAPVVAVSARPPPQGPRRRSRLRGSRGHTVERMPDAPEPPRSKRPKLWRVDREPDSPKRAVVDAVMGLVLGPLLMAAGDHFGGVEFEHGSKRSSGFYFFVLFAGGLVFGWGAVRLVSAWRMVRLRRRLRTGRDRRIDPDAFD